MSSQRGNVRKSGPPKHANTKAFHHNKGSKKTAEIYSLKISGFCQRCFEIIEWRKKYRKYKPLTQPAKCSGCGEKAVKQAYHTICAKCVEARGGVCAKCLQPKDIIPSDQKTTAQIQAEIQDEEDLISSMRERERRTYLRLKENDGDPEQIEKLAAKARSRLERNKLGQDTFSDDDFDFDDSDDDDDDNGNKNLNSHKSAMQTKNDNTSRSGNDKPSSSNDNAISDKLHNVHLTKKSNSAEEDHHQDDDPEEDNDVNDGFDENAEGEEEDD